MSLDERQRAMLAEMGIRVWQPEAEPQSPADGDAAGAPAPTAAVGQAAAPARPATVARAPVGERPSAINPDLIAIHQDRTPTTAAFESEAAPPGPPRAVPIARAPRPEGIERMDWPALQAAVAGCGACVLCESRRNTVFGVGSRQAEWMVVGEAPGENEDRQGEPFVGQAGKLLDAMLAAIGLSRRAGDAPVSGATSQDVTPTNGQNPSKSGVFIANVLKCRPPGNRNPQPEEVAQCEPYLRRQVELVQPKIILAMGRFAVQSLLQTTEPIGRLRGRVHHYAGVPVVVTYHPAYLLRNLADKAKAWEDLCLAMQVREQGDRPGDPA